MDISKLINIKNKVEKLSKIHQIEILRIFNNGSNVTINENKNGIFINLTDISLDIMTQIDYYLQYVSTQESVLNEVEVTKGDYINTFFTDDVSSDIPDIISKELKIKDNKEIELNN